MENNDFMIVSCERKPLSKGTRIYNTIFGLIVIGFYLINYQVQWIPLIILGILSIVYGLVGKELLKTKKSIALTQSEVLIKRSFQQDVKVDLRDVNRIVFDLNELQFHFSDYIKAYDLSWLSSDEHKRLKEKLNAIDK